jgi:hypothetical protein
MSVCGKHLFAFVCLTPLTVALVGASTFSFAGPAVGQAGVQLFSLEGDHPSTWDSGDGFLQSPPGDPPYSPGGDLGLGLGMDLGAGNWQYDPDPIFHGDWDHGLDLQQRDAQPKDPPIEAPESSTLALVGAAVMALAFTRGNARFSRWSGGKA